MIAKLDRTESGSTKKVTAVFGVHDDECKSTFNLTDIGDRLCAKDRGRKDVCNSDDGSALVHFNHEMGTWTFVGITSFGRKCDGDDELEHNSGLYTRVETHMEWILSKLAVKH